MDLHLGRKVAVVGGGSRGIGAATVRALAAEGCELVVGARGPEGLKALQQELRTSGAVLHPVAVDLTVAGGPDAISREPRVRTPEA